jgi:hypothetical protein
LIGLALPLASHGAIATWNFDSGTDNNTPFNGVPYAANSYSHTAFSTPAPSLGATTSANVGITAANGTGNPGRGLQFITTSSSGSVSGSTFTLTLKAAVNLGSVSITYDYLADNVGGGASAANNWTWTITGGGSGSGTGSAVTISQDNAWHTTTVNFSGLNLTAGETIVFTDTLAGYQTGNNKIASFDNINVVPEPIHYALVAFGLCVACVWAGRRVYFWARA